MISLFVNEILPLQKKTPPHNKREPRHAENNEHMQDSKDHSNSLLEIFMA